MPTNFPRITISIARSKDGTDATGDLNSLSIGFGIFQAWIYVAIFGAASVFSGNGIIPFFPGLTPDMAWIVFISVVVAISVALLLLAFSNQILLKFYVGKNALILATSLASLGTFLMYVTAAGGEFGYLCAVASGIAMATGASLMIVLWGTAFSRSEFTTITLNTTIAVVIGFAIYLAITHWIPKPFSGIVSGLLPIPASILLWKLTPIPYYRRQEIPIFHPLPIHRTAFVLRFGIPTIIFGFALGAIRHVCVGSVLPAGDVTAQLVMGMAACFSVAIIVAIVTISKAESHWDILFRCLCPIIAAGMLAIPFLDSEYVLLANFLIICGFMCFETLMWVFFADVAQEFRLSPIFVFGLGRGLLELGSTAGSALAQWPTDPTAGLFHNADGAMFLVFALVVACALLPRHREINTIIDPNHSFAQPGLDRLRTVLDKEAAAAKPADATVAAEDTEAGVAGEDAVAEVDERSRAKGRFHSRCEEIADRYLLSRRETEVMFLLAKGHNAAFIQDKLCISKSTAKTHINHIYRKLDIHTQQELLNMVEDNSPVSESPVAMGARSQEAPNLRTDIFESRR